MENDMISGELVVAAINSNLLVELSVLELP